MSNNLRGGGGRPDTSLGMSVERPFNTWTFDKHCEAMEWTPPPDVQLTVESAAAKEVDADLIVVGVFAPAKGEGDEEEEEEEPSPIVLTGAAMELDGLLDGALTDLAAENAKAFKNGGSAGAITPAARITAGGKTRRYVLLGLGAAPKDGGSVEPAVATKAGDAVAAAAHEHKKVTTGGVILPTAAGASDFLQGFSAAFHAGLYSDNRFRTGKKVEMRAEDVRTVRLFLEEAGGAADADATSLAIATGARLAKGISLTRDIVNAPHNVLNSESLADTARRIAEESGGCITCEILGKEECEARGMGAYLGVARGSETQPQFIHLTYKPQDGGDIK